MSNPIRNKAASFEVLSLADLIADQWDMEKVFAQIDDLVGRFPMPEHPGNDLGTDEKWRALMLDLPSCVYCLIKNRGKIVGYWSCFAVNDETFNRGMRGENINSAINVPDVDELIIPGDYLAYFVDLFVYKEYRNFLTNSLLYKSFVIFLKSHAKKGIFFRRIFAHTSSYDSIRLCERAGFKNITDHSCHMMKNLEGKLVPTRIYCVELHNPADVYLFGLDHQLMKLYFSHYNGSINRTAFGLGISKSADELKMQGESKTVEFKSTLRANLRNKDSIDDRMQHSALKTLAAFLNTSGGALIIGIDDNGVALGLAADNFANEDQMERHLMSLVRDKIGPAILPYMWPSFENVGGKRVLFVRCGSSPNAAFVKDGENHRFYIRAGASTEELQGKAMTDYSKSRFS